MVTTLYLIRHGETEGSGAKRYHGSIDVALSEKGARQIMASSAFVMEHLASANSSRYLSYLREIHNSPDSKNESAGGNPGLSAVYCSNLSRSARSAEIIANPHSLIPVEIKDLRERSFGIWEGMTFIEIKEKYPKEFGSWADNPLKYSPVGGESTTEVGERVLQALDEILDKHKGENIALVAHGGVNRIILCHIMGIPLENIFRIEQDHASVNIIEFWDKYPVVKLLNGLPSAVQGGIQGEER